nr:hypothetical protein [Shewanella kaireitica]
MLDQHQQLVHSENVSVLSHVQREKDDWVLHTVMIENCDTAFKFKRRKKYKCLKGARVNMTYYSATEGIAGFEIDVFKVVRIKRS